MQEPDGASLRVERWGGAVARMALVMGAGLLLANCAQQPGGRRAGGYTQQESREIGAFSQSRYGRASDRVVADGDPVPKGGGRDHIGRPYTIAGRRYVPYDKRPGHTEMGGASWYGVAFHGRRTANGEVFDRHSISAAHKTMPLPSYARVSNLVNGRSIIVRVNDRGPYHAGRVIDLSQRAAELLEYRASGSTRVKVEYLGRASLAGSDDRKLVATLRTDGGPAPTPDGFGGQSRVMVASVDEPAQSYRTGLFGFSGPTPEPAAETRSTPASIPVAVTPSIRPAAAAPVVASAAPPIGTTVALPLPPERPFDLGTIPNAATPVMSAVPGLAPSSVATTAPVRRAGPVVATMFYAEPARITLRFAKSDPWAALKPQTFKLLGDSRRGS